MRGNSTYNDMLILIYICIYIYILTFVHIHLNNIIIIIHISIKKRVYTILFFTHNYGDHIAWSFEG